MNIYNNYSPQRSPPFEKIFARVKSRGSGFRHPYPLCKKTRPCTNISKERKAERYKTTDFKLCRLIAFGRFFWLMFGYALVSVWLYFGFPLVIARLSE